MTGRQQIVRLLPLVLLVVLVIVGLRGAVPAPRWDGPLRTDGIAMAVSHRTRPIEGVQFHPESILTTYGSAIIATFVRGLRSVPAAETG